MATIEVSDELRAAAAYFGTAGQRWLEELPALVASLEADWGITVGRALTGGNWAYVAEAATADGRPAVLKVAPPPTVEGLTHQIRGLQVAHGDPYVTLIECDEERLAMLLERLGRQLAELAWPTDRQIRVSASTVARGWRPVNGDGLVSGASKAEWLADFIPRTWEKLNRPCSERAIERAIEYARERARALAGTAPVLVHGDAHPWNVLEARPGGVAAGVGDDFRLIDPEGLASEPAHDLGVILRGWNEELLEADDPAGAAFERFDSVSRQTGVSRESMWRWSYIERVSSGLVLLELGQIVDSRVYLGVADRLAGVTPAWA